MRSASNQMLHYSSVYPGGRVAGRVAYTHGAAAASASGDKHSDTCVVLYHGDSDSDNSLPSGDGNDHHAACVSAGMEGARHHVFTVGSSSSLSITRRSTTMGVSRPPANLSAACGSGLVRS